jgi:uncharacterized membrane protein YfhO
MGIVLNQSLKKHNNYLYWFCIGAINTIYLYPFFLGATYYALTNYVLSASSIIMPLLAFGCKIP